MLTFILTGYALGFLISGLMIFSVVCLYNSKFPQQIYFKRLLATLTIFLAVLAGMHEVIPRLHATLPIHAYRFYSTLFLFLSASTGVVLGRKSWARRPFAIALQAAICFICFLFSANDIYLLNVIPTDADRTLTFPSECRTTLTEVATTFSDVPRVLDPHWVSDEMNLTGFATANGLFVESTIKARFYHGLTSLVNPQAFTWGVPSVPSHLKLFEIYAKYLGVGCFILDRDLPADYRGLFKQPVVNLARAGAPPLYLYRLFQPAVFSLTKSPTLGSSADFLTDSERWWINPEQINQMLIRSDARDFPVSPTERAGSIEEINWDELRIRVPTHDRASYYIARTFGKNWGATSSSGAPLDIYLAGPGNMVVVASGDFTLKFRRSLTEKISFCVSLLALLYAVSELIKSALRRP